MKKIFLFLILIICIGCSDKELKDFSNTLSESIEKSQEKPKYVDTNPITVGLYKKGKLVKDYNSKFKDHYDVAVFNVIYSNDEDLGSTNLKKNWNKYYSKYENIDDYKIGFYLEFEADGKKIENKILDPTAKYNSAPYIFIYLYDGIHQKDGAWYSHLNPEDVKEDTIYSSIKLYMDKETNKISSPIKLTVFTYKDELDFDESGMYRGNSSYTATIYNK